MKNSKIRFKNNHKKHKDINISININKLNIIILSVITLTLITVTGVSFAGFITSHETEQKDLFETGELVLTYSDNSSEDINLVNTIPVSDEYGLSTTPYTFTIKNTGTYDASYSISLDEVTNTNQIPSDLIKYAISVDKSNYIGLASDELIFEGILIPNEGKTFDLRLWIDYSATSEIKNKSYSAKLKVEGIVFKDTLTPSNKDEISVLNNSTQGDIKNLKIYGNTIDTGSVGDDGNITLNVFQNLFTNGMGELGNNEYYDQFNYSDTRYKSLGSFNYSGDKKKNYFYLI